MLILEVLNHYFPNRPGKLFETLIEENPYSPKEAYIWPSITACGCWSESIFSSKLLMEMADNTQERLTLELTNFKF